MAHKKNVLNVIYFDYDNYYNEVVHSCQMNEAHNFEIEMFPLVSFQFFM